MVLWLFGYNPNIDSVIELLSYNYVNTASVPRLPHSTPKLSRNGATLHTRGEEATRNTGPSPAAPKGAWLAADDTASSKDPQTHKISLSPPHTTRWNGAGTVPWRRQGALHTSGEGARPRVGRPRRRGGGLAAAGDTAAANCKPRKYALHPTQHAEIEPERSGGGAKARSTPRVKGLGRARAALAAPEGAWAAADDTAAVIAMSRAHQQWPAVAATIALAGDRYCIQRDPLLCARWLPKRRRRPPSCRRRWGMSTRFSQHGDRGAALRAAQPSARRPPVCMGRWAAAHLGRFRAQIAA